MEAAADFEYVRDDDRPGLRLICGQGTDDSGFAVGNALDTGIFRVLPAGFILRI